MGPLHLQHADAAAIDAGNAAFPSYPLVLTNEWAEANLPDGTSGFAGFRAVSELNDLPEAFNPAIATPLERGQWLENVRTEVANIALVEKKVLAALDANNGEDLPFDEFASTVPELSTDALTKAIKELIRRGTPIDVTADENDGTIELICTVTQVAAAAPMAAD